ncbi:MAG: hypothetical protein AAFQ87_00205, partial [Bacteroidota bacterium]
QVAPISVQVAPVELSSVRLIVAIIGAVSSEAVARAVLISELAHNALQTVAISVRARSVAVHLVVHINDLRLSAVAAPNALAPRLAAVRLVVAAIADPAALAAAARPA